MQPMKRRVLVVDDNGDTCDLTRMILEGDGYGVRTACSAGAALSLIEEEVPDLLLLDINMPGMDGFELLRLLHQSEGAAELPVVMFSVKSEIRDKIHALQRGAVDYISKPFSPEDLLDRVRRIFESMEVSH